MLPPSGTIQYSPIWLSFSFTTSIFEGSTRSWKISRYDLSWKLIIHSFILITFITNLRYLVTIVLPVGKCSARIWCAVDPSAERESPALVDVESLFDEVESVRLLCAMVRDRPLTRRRVPTGAQPFIVLILTEYLNLCLKLSDNNNLRMSKRIYAHLDRIATRTDRTEILSTASGERPSGIL